MSFFGHRAYKNRDAQPHTFVHTPSEWSYRFLVLLLNNPEDGHFLCVCASLAWLLAWYIQVDRMLLWFLESLPAKGDKRVVPHNHDCVTSKAGESLLCRTFSCKTSSSGNPASIRAHFTRSLSGSFSVTYYITWVFFCIISVTTVVMLKS